MEDIKRKGGLPIRISPNVSEDTGRRKEGGGSGVGKPVDIEVSPEYTSADKALGRSTSTHSVNNTVPHRRFNPSRTMAKKR